MAMQPIPKEYKEYIESHLPELSAGLVDCLEETAPSTAVRLNSRKPGVAIPGGEDGVSVVAWCVEGRYLPQRPDFTHDPALHQGRYYVQDASSMITHRVVGVLADRLGGGATLRMLDACAAPGGKTTAAIDALPNGALVVANEYDYRRAEILKENVAKWGYPAVVVSRGDTSRYCKLPGWFDIVAADVPCSGEGMMRKDETARTQWSESLVRECAATQRQIVTNLWKTLRPGGYLLYSTCTFNREENEENVAWIISTYGAEPVEIDLPQECCVVRGENHSMRFLPTRIEGEGLFMAVLRKPEDDGAVVGARVPKKRKETKGKTSINGKKVGVADMSACAKWLKGGYSLKMRGDADVCAVPAGWADAIAELEGALDVIACGVDVGTVKGKNIAPQQGLALSLALEPCAFATVDVDLATALAYLRRESLPAVSEVKGYVLLTYGGYPLGFVNNLPPTRANNLYPAPWRILK